MLMLLFWGSNAQAWYQCEWSQRTELSFTNPTAQNLSQYPLLLEVDAAFFPAQHDWSTQGKDIRFVAGDDITLLTHFIESRE